MQTNPQLLGIDISARQQKDGSPLGDERRYNPHRRL
jgi:hypothetical protein